MRRLPRPAWENIESVLRTLESASLGPEGLPEGAAGVDALLLGAARKDLLAFLGKLFTLFGMRLASGLHSVRPVQIMTALGWTVASECYVPKQPSVLRKALGIRAKATAAARDAAERCGALCGSFREGADMLLRLTGIRVSVSKLRKMTLAFGKACAAEQDAPAPDVRHYKGRPPAAAKPVDRTLFCMADGGSANCCKADTEGVKGKDGGEAGTRQIRVGVLGEYAWLDKDGRPLPWEESFSYLVSGENIEAFTALIKKHGLARGSGTAARMLCLADGEPALERSLRDAFPHALFANDFSHASGHLSACCLALGLGEAPAAKEYRFCRGLLYRVGAESVVRRIRRLYADRLESSPEALKELLYLEKRKDNMRYGWLRKNGYYIGSGHVEAAVRVLVVRRCKQAGMHWRHANAVRMAAIHARYRSHPKAS
jgi:hypothetical protein